jgi:hypothetical protein
MKKIEKRNEIIYCKITSDGATGEEWIERLEEKGAKIKDGLRTFLLSKKFRPTSGLTREVQIVKGEIFYDNIKVTHNKITKKAEKNKFRTADAEIICLMREKFSDSELEKMGLDWVIRINNSPDSGHVSLVFVLTTAVSIILLARYTQLGIFTMTFLVSCIGVGATAFMIRSFPPKKYSHPSEH